MQNDPKWKQKKKKLQVNIITATYNQLISWSTHLTFNNQKVIQSNALSYNT